MMITPEKFRAVIAKHQKMVFLIALRLTGDRSSAEEVAQDVFMEFYRGADKLKTEDHIRLWLRRVSVHRATDVLRKRSRQPEYAAEEWLEEQHDESIVVAENFAIEARLQELLQTLPEAMRLVVVLRYLEDMLPDEIATLLSQPVETVKSNLKRGLNLLRRKAQITMGEYIR